MGALIPNREARVTRGKKSAARRLSLRASLAAFCASMACLEAFLAMRKSRLDLASASSRSAARSASTLMSRMARTSRSFGMAILRSLMTFAIFLTALSSGVAESMTS